MPNYHWCPSRGEAPLFTGTLSAGPQGPSGRVTQLPAQSQRQQLNHLLASEQAAHQPPHGQQWDWHRYRRLREKWEGLRTEGKADQEIERREAVVREGAKQPSGCRPRQGRHITKRPWNGPVVARLPRWAEPGVPWASKQDLVRDEEEGHKSPSLFSQFGATARADSP